MRTVFRYKVPVDDQPHTFEMHGKLVAVGCRALYAVEFWAIWDTTLPEVSRTFQVFGTGQPDVIGEHRGTVIAPGGELVWHLFELGGAS